MKDIEFLSGEFEMCMKEATSFLKNFEYDKAYTSIMKAMNASPNAAEPHNLLGIWYEFKRNNDLARKHYRVAYVLNPTYKPASENLERVSTLFSHKEIPVNYGEVMNEETDTVKNGGNLIKEN